VLVDSRPALTQAGQQSPRRNYGATSFRAEEISKISDMPCEGFQRRDGLYNGKEKSERKRDRKRKRSTSDSKELDKNH